MYPWVITKDDEIGVSPNLKELTSRFLSKRLSNIFGTEDADSRGGVKVAESFTKISVDVRCVRDDMHYAFCLLVLGCFVGVRHSQPPCFHPRS
jgi:hypothetical protein